MKIKHKPRIGYVGVSIPAYFAEKYQVRETSIAGLKQYGDELGFDLIAIERPILSAEDAAAAARELQEHEIDFLLIQNAACSMGNSFIRCSKWHRGSVCGRSPIRVRTGKYNCIRWYR